jgi:hypothetical protein
MSSSSTQDIVSPQNPETFNVYHIESDGKIVHLNPPASPSPDGKENISETQNLTIEIPTTMETEVPETPPQSPCLSPGPERMEDFDQYYSNANEQVGQATQMISETEVGQSAQMNNETDEAGPSIKTETTETDTDEAGAESDEYSEAKLRYKEFHSYLEKLVLSKLLKSEQKYK